MFFKIKSTTPFKKLMDAYCQRQGVIFLDYFSCQQATSDSCSTERDCIKPKHQRTLIWRTVTRSMFWSSKWEELNDILWNLILYKVHRLISKNNLSQIKYRKKENSISKLILKLQINNTRYYLIQKLIDISFKINIIITYQLYTLVYKIGITILDK